MGAPVGNTNSRADNRLWGNTIRRHAVQNAEQARKIVEKLFAMAEAGDIAAMKEIADRLDGRAHQTLDANVTGNLAEVLAGIGSKSNDPPLAG